MNFSLYKCNDIYHIFKWSSKTISLALSHSNKKSIYIFKSFYDKKNQKTIDYISFEFLLKTWINYLSMWSFNSQQKNIKIGIL